MAQYRLLALDLDETLLTNNKRISSQTKYWIAQTMKKGIIVMMATGRGLQRVDYILEELSLDSPMVLVNGAEVWKKPGHLMTRHYLNKEDIFSLHRLAVTEGAIFWGYNENRLVGSRDWTSELFHERWMKFGIRIDDQIVLKQMRERLNDYENLEITSSSPTNIEITYKGITKETGVRQICRLCNVRMEEVIAIGDSMNDAKLIKSAGLGVAMGNAHDELKALSDVVTTSNEEDGVAHTIKKYIFGESVQQLDLLVEE